MSGESKRRRPLGPLDDYCSDLEEELAQARTLLEHWFHGRGYIGEETIDAVTQAFLARAPAQTAEHDYVDPMLSGYAAQTAEPCPRCRWADGCQRAESAEAAIAAALRECDDFEVADGAHQGPSPRVTIQRIRDLLLARNGGGNG